MSNRCYRTRAPAAGVLISDFAATIGCLFDQQVHLLLYLGWPVNGGRSLDKDDLIPLTEAAGIAKMTHEHLRLLARKGLLRARKIGRNWVTTRQDVLEYLRDESKRSRDPHKRKR